MLKTLVPEARHDQRRRGGADVYEFFCRVALLVEMAVKKTGAVPNLFFAGFASIYDLLSDV